MSGTLKAFSFLMHFLGCISYIEGVSMLFILSVFVKTTKYLDKMHKKFKVHK